MERDMETARTYAGSRLDAAGRGERSKRRVALVENLSPHSRRPLFDLLARRFDLACFFFASPEPYWNPLLPTFEQGDFRDVGLKRLSILGEPMLPGLARRL